MESPIERNREAEFRQEYKELLQAIAERIKSLLKRGEGRSFSIPKTGKQNLELKIKVAGREIYRQDLATGKVKKISYSPEAFAKLKTAIDNPKALKGTVEIKLGKESIYQNSNGRIRAVKQFDISQLRSLVEDRQREERPTVRTRQAAAPSPDRPAKARPVPQAKPAPAPSSDRSAEQRPAAHSQPEAKPAPQLSVEERLDRLEQRLSNFGEPGETLVAKLDLVEQKLDALLSRRTASPDLNRWFQQTQHRVVGAWQQAKVAVGRLWQQVREIPTAIQQQARATSQQVQQKVAQKVEGVREFSTSVQQQARATTEQVKQQVGTIRQAAVEKAAEPNIDFLRERVRQKGILGEDGSHHLVTNGFKYSVALNGDITLRRLGKEKSSLIAEYGQKQSPAARAKGKQVLEQISAKAQQGRQQPVVAEQARRGRRR